MFLMPAASCNQPSWEVVCPVPALTTGSVRSETRLPSLRIQDVAHKGSGALSGPEGQERHPGSAA